MLSGSLFEPSLSELIETYRLLAKQQANRQDDPLIVVSPYRFNPLGAHIDHQGGPVMARTLNQYTVLCFWPSAEERCEVHAKLNDIDGWQTSTFKHRYENSVYGWDAMARASFSALAESRENLRGMQAVVFGTLLSGGLSSSASVILAYLTAMAHVNGIKLSNKALVELVRKVENDFRGLNNGIQDQMSIVFGQANSTSILDVNSCSADAVPDPPSIDEVRFLMCFSGVTRDLAGSGFNTRVAECNQAAKQLDPTANHLGEVPNTRRDEQSLARLPDTLRRRATHVYGEMERVRQGAKAWRQGDWELFGQLMNRSCMSSIYQYESGSEWLIKLHEIAKDTPGVYGNRFSGGGYGGCLFMLVSAESIQTVAEHVLSTYLLQYPEFQEKAKLVVVESEMGVRLFQA